MPKLKKFRVVNLVYNETRHIYDEIFDFNEGKNTMMLLANGGGKTVLTQMMLQPVIPKTDLKTRKFIDYFKHNKRPTLLMSEWLLDDGTSSLLTGLVIMNKIRKKRGTEDITETLDIVAFTIEYHYSDTYKIDTLPVTFRDETGRKTMYDYDLIVNDLKKHEQKFKQFVSVFNWSDSREAKDQYNKKLGQHGIVQQEWKDNILKINKEEAGLKSFFEDAKTSVTLLKKKILPTIESKLDENEKDKVELQSLFKKHTIELVNNKKIINNEKLYKQFLSESYGFEEKANRFNMAQKSYIESVQNVQSLHKGLGVLIDQTNRSIQESEEAKISNRRMIEQIKFEEECFKYYKKLLNYENLLVDIEQVNSFLNELKEESSKASIKEKIIAGTKLYGELSAIEKKLEVKKEEYNRLLGHDQAHDYQQVNEVLLLKFRDREQVIETLIEECQIKMKDIQKVSSALVKDKEILLKQQRVEQDNIAVYKNKTEEFEAHINKTNSENSEFKWHKHPLYDDYEVVELDNYRDQLSKEEDQGNKLIHDLNTSLIQKEEESKGLLIHIQDLRISITEEKEKLKQFKIELDTYLSKETEIYDQLKVEQINKEELYDEEYVSDQINVIIRSKEDKYNHLTIERAITEELAESLREGKLVNLPEEVKELLEEHHIEFTYGFDWLKHHEGDRIPESLYMEDLNILPYGLIMDRKNYTNFKELTKEYEMNKVLPIINEELINDILEGKTHSHVEPGIYLHTAFKKHLLNPDYTRNQIDLLSEKVKDIKDQQDLILKSKNNYYELLANYKGFIKIYDSKSKETLSHKVIESEESIISCEDSIKGSEASIETIKKDVNHLKERLKSEKEILEDLLKTIKKYKEIGVAYKQYGDNKKHLSDSRKLIKTVEKDINIIENEFKANQDQLLLTKDKSKTYKAEKEEIAKDCMLLGELEVNDTLRDLPLFKENINSLKAKQEVFKSALGDIRSVEDLLDVYLKQEKSLVEKLEELDLQEEDYQNKTYDKEDHQEIIKVIEDVENKIKLKETELTQKGSKADTLKEALNAEKEEILSKQNREVLVKQEDIIYTDFKLRKSESQKDYNQIRDKIDGLNKLMVELDTSLNETKIDMNSQFVVIEDYDLSLDVEIEAYIMNEGVTHVEVRTKRQEVIKEMQQNLRSADQMKQELSKAYMQLRTDYYNKNDLLNNMFNHLLKESSLGDFDFLKRVLKQTRESIERKLEKYDADIKALKDKEANLFNFVLTKVSNVYDELSEIDRHSIIDLYDKRQKMLYIQLPKKETVDLSRIKLYLHDVIRIAKGKYEKQEINELDKYLDDHLKLDHLFDEYVPIANIGVNISKIEENKVSKMTWEKVGKASGGELFVSVFIVFSSLLSYTRGYKLSHKEQGNVLVMDNPFGPVSSEHLLEPLFKIAETYDTQMICFTHINTSGITSQFDLIYSLRVIQEGGSGREHLEVELSKNKAKDIEIIDSGKFEIGSGDQVGFL